MYCRNCSNEVHEKAVACPKCGVNPRTEKKYCNACGVATNENQVMCVQCGVSLSNFVFSFDTSKIPKVELGSLPKFDVQGLINNRSSLAAAVALLTCFFPWVKINVFYASQSLSVFGLSKVVEYAPNTILISFFLYLLPICLIGFIAADYFESISKYKSMFIMASLGLVIYAGIGLYMTSHPSVPEMQSSGNTGLDQLLGGIANGAQQLVKDVVSIGFGYYLTLISTIVSFYLYRINHK